MSGVFQVSSRWFPTACLLALLCSASLQAAESPEEQAIRQMIRVMTPVHDQWLQESEAFAEQADAFCASGKNLEDLRTQWRKTQMRWNALSTFAVGPLTENGYLNTQVEYWPDKKNLVQFQIRAALQQASPEKLDVAQLSVVLRGLSASEFILFDPEVRLEPDSERQRYCPMLVSVAAYQKHLAQQVRQEWRTYEPTLRVPDKRYASSHDVLTEWLRIDVSSLEMLHKKVALPLGGLAGGTASSVPGKQRPQPYQAEFWRSGQSIASLRSALDVQQQIWQQGWRPLVQAQDAALATKIDGSLARNRQIAESLDGPMTALLNDPEGTRNLLALYQSLGELRLLYEVQVAKALGVQIGFNANDGD